MIYSSVFYFAAYKFYYIDYFSSVKGLLTYYEIYAADNLDYYENSCANHW